IRAEWKETPQPSDKELFALLKKSTGERGGFEGRSNTAKGSMDEGLAAADQKLQATYTIAYIAHAPLDPRAALAEWKDDKLIVWTTRVRSNATSTAGDFQNSSSAASAIRTLYHIPNQRIAFHSAQSPLRQRSNRALVDTDNHFARESHISELAHAIEMDSLAF